MALIIADRVKETSTTTGTGNFSLAGAAVGFRAFSAVCANNDYVHYVIQHQSANEWEIGLGQWQTGGTLVRAAGNVLNGSAGAGTLVNFSAGTKDVFISNPLEHRLVLPQLTADPAAPSSGGLLYNRKKANLDTPYYRGATGLPLSLMAMCISHRELRWLPGTGTTASINFGINWTVDATQAHPAIASTNRMTRQRRATYTTTTTAGNASGVRTAAAVASREAGFFFHARFGILTYTSTMQVWCGLSALSTLLAGEPSAQNDSAVMSKDSGETVWQVLTRDTVSASKTSTGRNTAAAGDAEIFDVFIYCAPGGNVWFRVEEVGTGTVVLADTEKSANLPTSTAQLYIHTAFRNSAGGAGSGVAGFLVRASLFSEL